MKNWRRKQQQHIGNWNAGRYVVNDLQDPSLLQKKLNLKCGGRQARSNLTFTQTTQRIQELSTVGSSEVGLKGK